MPRARIVVPANVALTRAHLNWLECPCGAEHPITISPVCHPDHPMDVTYDKNDGVLIVTCGTCNATVVRIAVAGGRATPKSTEN